MPGRLVRQGGGWIRNVANTVLPVAGYYATQYARSAVKQQAKKAAKNDQATAVTGQSDHKVRFQSKRKGKKGYRRMKKARAFRHRVLKCLQQDQNPQWFRFKYASTQACTVNNQAIIALGGLYSWVGDGSFQGDDIAKIYKDMDPVLYQQEAGGAVTGMSDRTRSKFTVKSAHMEVDVSNVGTAAVILDVYEMICRRDTVGFTNALGMITAPSTYWKGDTSSTGPMSSTTIGTTPYQMDDITGCFKIIGKSTYQIPASGSIQLSMSGGRPKNFYGSVISQALANGDCWGRKGCTKFYLATMRGVPTTTGDSGASQISWSNRRVYNVSLASNLLPDTSTKHGY